jgi:hypothetical protein
MYKIRSKQHFQLLEVMVAIFLIVVCALPVLNAYVGMNKAQFDSARTSQRDHLVHLVHGRIVEELYCNRIPWEEIEHSKQEELERLGHVEELVNQFKSISYRCCYQLKIERPKIIKSNSKKFLFSLAISVQDLQGKGSVPVVYRYYIFAKHE